MPTILCTADSLLLLFALLLQYPRPEYVAADLSKVKLADALAATSFDPTQPALFTAGGFTSKPLNMPWRS
jgi:hypothetical protein